jgi:hypothetical protein
MTESISQRASWHSVSQHILVESLLTSAVLLAFGVALTILKSFGTIPLVLFCTGGVSLGASMIYSLISCVKRSSPPHTILSQLSDDEVQRVLVTVLTQTREEREESCRQLAQLGEHKSNEERARAWLYTFTHQGVMIGHLIDTLPRLQEFLQALDSRPVYDSLTDQAKKLRNTSRVTQIFLLLDDVHRCALLQAHINNKDLFLALIENAPSTTKEALRKSNWPELLRLANDLLDGWIVRDVFYDVYAALSDEHQIRCLERILKESKFSFRRVEMIKKTQAALLHPIEFIECALKTLPSYEQMSYCGQYLSSYSRDKFAKLFDEIILTLPKFHIVTFFWRVARTQLKVWFWDTGGRRCRWVPHFQGSQEDKKFFKSLSFEQVTRLSQTGQPWVAMWSLSERSDEIVVNLCFNQLERATNAVTEYKDRFFSQEGRLFNRNWSDFLDLLSFRQVTMLICHDPHLIHLNQIFGFKDEDVNVPNELLAGIPCSSRTSLDLLFRDVSSQYVSIPAILQRWWELSLNQVKPKECIEALLALKLEEKYTKYFTYKYNNYRKPRSYRTQPASSLSKNRAMIKTSLEALGLDTKEKHTKAGIDRFVRKELSKCHPDKHSGAAAEAKTKKITEARSNLFAALEQERLEKTPRF